MPKPPPTSGAITRTLWGGSPSAATRPCWTKWETWVPFQVVSAAVAASHARPRRASRSACRRSAGCRSARAPRTSAAAKARVHVADAGREADGDVVAPVRVDQRARPARRAATMSATTGKRLPVHLDRSAASSARARLSATTMATISPTWRARSRQSASCGAWRMSKPTARRARAAPHRTGQRLHPALEIGEGEHANDAGHAAPPLCGCRRCARERGASAGRRRGGCRGA